MSLSPNNILQRLQELKLWQENHEELLKKTKSLVNSSGNVTTLSDYQTIEGLSAFDSSMERSSTKNWESQAISPTKSFNELLEEKLAQEPEAVKNPLPQKPKKPFLKKGAGLERFRMKPCPKIKFNKRPKPKLEEAKVTPLKVPDLAIKSKASWQKVETEPVKKIDEPVIKTPEPSDQTLYEKALEKELLIFEALEQKAENSSFCSTDSSVLRILSSTPSKIKKPPIIEEKRVHWQSESEDEDVIETNLEKKDIEEILLRLKQFSDNNKNIPPIIETSEEEKWSTSSSQDTSISSSDLELTLKTRDVAVCTNESKEQRCTFCQTKLDEKIKEYEKRIDEVIEDKNRINEIKQELERKREILEREYTKMKREFEEEKRVLIFDLENEKKKLVKEKQVFQTYVKDSQNRPNKKEREEISNLKQEVADLRETLKLKDSKNGMTQARLRNQIKQLEKENCNLKEEVEKLTKENAKLTAAQKLNRRPSETKILHEINKNINKLTQETIKSKKSEEISQKIEDREDSLLELANTKVLDHTNIEKLYEHTFRNEQKQNVSRNESQSNKVEQILEDGSKLIKYSNGNTKTISPDGNFITIKYFNGDVQETNLLDGTVKYFFYTKNIWQTTYADGFELVEFPDGIKEKRYVDGKCEILLPDDVIQTTHPDGSQETKYPDGSMVQVRSNGDKILLLPNGQKEIETKDFKKREYPDGTVKTLYPDGTQETKYSNGRIRIKDKNGKLILDTQQ